MRKKVMVVIPTRNEEKYIGQCLDSFTKQTYPKEYLDIFVSDGMSTDNTRNIIKQYQDKFSNIKILDNEGLTAPKGFNLAIKKTNADIVIIFGAHAFADKDFVKFNVEELQNEDVGCSGGPIETISEDAKGTAIALAMSSPFGVGNALFRYAQKKMFVDTVAFGAYRKSLLDQVGYFDEELVRNQDDEINYRVLKSGYKILLTPKVKSTYYSRSSLKKLWKQYYQYGFWKVRVMQKHGKPASLRHLIPAFFVTTNVLGAIIGSFVKPIMYLWLLEIALYLICDILASFKSSKGNLRILKYMWAIFPILHISYGLGFIEGIISFYLLKSNKNIEKNTKLSR